MQFKRIAIDTSKSVFTLHGVDAEERVVLRRNLRRGAFEAFMAKLAPTEIAMEACGGSHHWGRQLQAMGHSVRLIPPQYVKPFVKRGKPDRNDAAAICEAASRPSMRFVPVRSAQAQADAMILSVRDTLVGERTRLANTLRGHAAEFGVIAAKGMTQVEPLLAEFAKRKEIPQPARDMLALLGAQIAQVDDKIAELDAQLKAKHQADPASKRLATIPGMGPIGALSLVLTVDPTRFASGRHFAAWLGLTPKARSTAGRACNGKISREGNERLRQLLVLGATAVIRHARPGSRSASPWLLQLLARRPRKLAAVALANKIARIAWAMMTSGETYRPHPVAG